MGVENIRIGACSITYGGVDLGFTKGGVVVAVETQAEPTNALGAPRDYDYRVTTTGVTVQCPLSEITASNFGVIFPWSASGKIEDGSGVLLRSFAKELVISPTNGSPGLSIPQAVAVSSIELAHRNDEEQVMQVTFRALAVSASDKTLMIFL